MIINGLGNAFVPSTPPARPALVGTDSVTLGTPSLGLGLKDRIKSIFRGRDPEAAYINVHKFGADVVAGRVRAEHVADRAEELGKDLKAGARSEKAPAASRKLLEESLFQREEGDFVNAERIANFLQGPAGLRSVARGELSINKEHEFEMSFAPGGGFRGSRSYEHEGRTFGFGYDILQKPGAGPSDPAAVYFRYSCPGFLGLQVKGNSLEGKSGATCLYFLPRLSDFQGRGDKSAVEDVSLVKKQIEEMVSSLDAAAPLSLQNYSYGYGRVGTTWHSQVITRGIDSLRDEDKALVAPAATEYALTDILGVR
ncbi:MAG: hypothetical protein FJX76_23390 [Armatimonadetes bacterium]|nr:hypothetical protein [Armatimonadota bacterium]